MSVLVIAENNNGILSPATRSAITAGKQLSSEVDLLLFEDTSSEANQIKGIRQVFILEHEGLVHQLPEHTAKLLAHWLNLQNTQYEYIITAASNFGKAMLPIVAAKLGVAQQSDVIRIVDAKTIIRPTYAGNAWVTVECLEKIKVMTIRATAFAREQETQSPCAVHYIAGPWINDILAKCFTKFISQTPVDKKRPELTEADVVVSGGRGLGDAKNFQLIYDLADSLHAAVGASRAAVDAGYISNEHQVGQTGVVVAPQLYVAVGISGAIQHISGMKDSKIIVAINKDPNAPIMQIANYRLIGDLFKIVPEWIQKIKQHRGNIK